MFLGISSFNFVISISIENFLMITPKLIRPLRLPPKTQTNIHKKFVEGLYIIPKSLFALNMKTFQRFRPQQNSPSKSILEILYLSMVKARYFLYFLLISLFASFCFAEIQFTEIRSDARRIIPLDEFGFTHTGRLELNVSQIVLSSTNSDLDLSKVGFFLRTDGAWMRISKQLENGEVTCALNSELVKVVANFKSLNGKSSLDTFYQENDPDQYTLAFANCLSQVKVSMHVRSAMYNLGSRDYISAGKTILPTVYFFFSLVYFTIAGIWIYVLYKRRLTIFRFHFFMLAAVVLKAFNLVCEAEAKSYIKRTGNAHGWDAFFYIFSLLKGITLFTLIVSIGSVWSFLNPSLHDKEKKVLLIVIPLQVVANIAPVVIDETLPPWNQVLSIVHLICSCLPSFPIDWSFENLVETTRTDPRFVLNMGKLLLLFRKYFPLVMSYMFITRDLGLILELLTPNKYLWTCVVAGELATLSLYVFAGMIETIISTVEPEEFLNAEVRSAVLSFEKAYKTNV